MQHYSPSGATTSNSTGSRRKAVDQPPTQAAATIVHDDDEDDFEEQQVDKNGKKRRLRYRVSCLPCQRKKCKCDGGAPCSSCTKRKLAEECEYGPVRFKDGTVAQLEYAELKTRLMELEAKMRRLDHLLLPEKVEGMDDSKENQATSVNVATFDRGDPDLSRLNDDARDYRQQAILPHETQDEQLYPSDSDDGEQPFDNAAETAALLLEERTLGHEHYGPLGGSRTVILGSLTKGSKDASLADTGSRHEVYDGIKTLITLHQDNHKQHHNSFVMRTRQRAMADLVASLPMPELGDFLVVEFLHSFDWVYKVIHRGTFLDEVQQLWQCVQRGQGDQIDPAWLALFYMVISWPSNTDSVRRSIGALYNVSMQDLESLTAQWRHCAEQALNVADWAAKPQIRALQALCLLMNYQDGKVAYPSAGNSAFYVWLAAGIRIAQILKLDKADEQDEEWLADDPAFPRGQSGIKMETCRRIWVLLLVSDWVFNSHAGRPCIAPGTFTTREPMRVNDEELGQSVVYAERPPHELTDVDFHTVRLGLANFQAAVNKFWASRQKSYQMILDLDSHLQKSLSTLPSTTQSANVYNKAHHRSAALCVLNNRRLRLHRPFLIKGMRGPSSRYSTSAKLCIESAEAICSALHAIVEAQKLDVYWYVFSQVLGAVICIFVDHFHKVMAHPEATKLAVSIPSIVAARDFYAAGMASTVSSVIQAAKRGQTVIDSLCHYEDELRAGSAGYDGSNMEKALTEVLHRTTELVERAGIASAAASPTAAPLVLSDFLALDAYSMAPSDSDLLGVGDPSHALHIGEGIPLQDEWLGQTGLVDWSSIFTDPGLFGP